MATPTGAIFEKPATLRTRVEEFLRASIMDGRIKGGERLRELELCEQLGISRSTLREALRTLEAERLISIEPHRGPTVVRITEKAARDLYALRALLEGYAAHEFARLADDADIERLRKAVDALHRQSKGSNKAALLAAKRDFYDVLLSGCDNDLVKDMLPGLLSRINLLRATSFARSDRLPESLAEIDHLFERIRARDPQGAQEAARSHIVNAERTALEVLRRQQEETQGSEGDRPRTEGRGSAGPAG
ncbi:GntR family transcriptional regulator [Achromobacter denitrificans]|jgi:DNA-binding GntR family transcriptional regulator|uniref:GntR family transcriptional regulator n=1 Tax=Achromobacter denitrificans TaxID=32002 RepID=A0A427WVX3_ACHDE|nr:MULTISPECIES: GntR family transcriptional regulator [Achromobacter]ASC65119.1 GntR family transcriptional regulator [Achromobacter denitrificans]MBV2160029.1 GntR family transcriptional regulator [Achromobacter denitrificans]MDF3847063.1 GntR family transcriptional regulator [Achromobacter denitrificans]MDF3860362.1 GntR family transcriptional regulator [Achromobacter denitrificans]MDF3939010.1 GntR family transcriptional regulator [Achromobacter denitrificans]